MAVLQDYGLVFDIVIAVLLVTAIGYASVLNRKLTALRNAKKDMEMLFAEFAAATSQAQGGLQALKEGSGPAGEALARSVSDACRLADEMAFLVKKGNEIADRLEVQIAASRKASQVTSSRVTPSPSTGSGATALRPAAPQAPQATKLAPPAADGSAEPAMKSPIKSAAEPTLGRAILESGALDAVKQQGAAGRVPEAAAPRGIAKLAKGKLSNADSELMRALQAIR